MFGKVSKYISAYISISSSLTFPAPIPDKEKKLI